MATSGARKTPRGARPNRRGEPARLVELAFRGSRFAAAARTRSLCDGASHLGEQPSGRPLESRREPRPRGMIAAACRRFHRRMRAQNPAYRLARHFQQLTNVKHPLRTSRLPGTVPIKLLHQVERKTAGIREFWPRCTAAYPNRRLLVQVVRNDNFRFADDTA
jgi:hypothetical protein